jgi:hypothetical protein
MRRLGRTVAQLCADWAGDGVRFVVLEPVGAEQLPCGRVERLDEHRRARRVRAPAWRIATYTIDTTTKNGGGAARSLTSGQTVLYVLTSGQTVLYVLTSGQSVLYVLTSGQSVLYVLTSGQTVLYVLTSGQTVLYVLTSGQTVLYVLMSGFHRSGSTLQLL